VYLFWQHTIVRPFPQLFLGGLNFVRSLRSDFEVGLKLRIWANLKRLSAVRYALGIFNFKPLVLLQIADSNTSALRTGADDIINFGDS
jgi:hypothetical protein